MLREERHDDVTRLRFASWTSRSLGFDVSVYVVRGVLIDTGFHRVRRELAVWLDAHAVQGAIVTHHHEDHAGNVDLLARRGIPVHLAADTVDRLRAPARLGWYRRWCWGVAPPMHPTPPPFVHGALAVIPAPGHSPDHHVVWDAEHETLFGGDLFLGVKVRVSHPWPREDVRAQVASIRQVIALRPRRLFDAHRGLVRDPVASLTAKADWLEATIAAADSMIAAGLDDRAIVQQLFGGSDWLSAVTFGDYSRGNFVGSVRGTHAAGATSRATGRIPPAGAS